MTGKILNVLYQSDDNYAMVSAISLASLLENNRHLAEINIFYCAYKVHKASIRKLESLIAGYQNASIRFIDANKYHNTLRETGVRPWHGVYVTWLKLLAFGDLKLKTDRVLFINGHTIINGQLDELIDLDFEDNTMALSYDCLTSEHKKSIGLKNSDPYYNAGIMLINYAKWKAEKTSKFILNHLAKKSDYLIADQDLCNVLFKDSIKPLDCTFNFSSAYYAYNVKHLLRVNKLNPENFYSYEEIMETYYSPKIIHSLFGINGKPWEQDNNHPQQFLWQKYLRMTPWRDSNRPIANKTVTRRLYKILPSFVFMQLYIIGVNRKYK